MTIMMAPGVLSALPQQTVAASSVGTVSVNTPVYDANGKANGVTLASGTSWQLGEKVTLNGVSNYQIGNNEYIPVAVVSNVSGSSTNNDDSETSTTGTSITDSNDVNGQVGTLTANTAIVNGSGKTTGQILSKGSQWIIGNNILTYNGAKYYQVATNEYVLASNLYIAQPNIDTNSSIPTPGNGLIGRTNLQMRTYNSEANAYDMTLPANTSWKISKLVVNKYGSYWGEVATNQWVWITDVTLNSGLNLGNNSYYVPNFATSINK